MAHWLWHRPEELWALGVAHVVREAFLERWEGREGEGRVSGWLVQSFSPILPYSPKVQG